MAGLAVDDAQGMAAGREIKIHRLDDRMLLVEEVNGHQIAHGRGRLIHKAAGFAKIFFFGKLSYFCKLNRRKSAAAEKNIEDVADENFKGGGGGKPHSRGNV